MMRGRVIKKKKKGRRSVRWQSERIDKDKQLLLKKKIKDVLTCGGSLHEKDVPSRDESFHLLCQCPQ